MMNLRKKLLTAGTIFLVSALALTGCVQDNGGKKNSPKPTTSTSAEPTPTGTPTQIPNDSADAELQAAQKAFPNAKATKDFTKEDVQLALLTASNYIAHASRNSYYLSGQFEKDSYPEKELANDFQKYFDYSSWATLLANFEDKTSTIKTPEGTTMPTYVNNMLSLVYFTRLNGGSQEEWLPKDCYAQSDKGSDGIACYQNLKTSNFKYEQANDGKGLLISTTVTFDQIFINGGKTGTQPITLSYQLELIKNDEKAVDYANGVPTMVIYDINNKVTWGNWTESK